MNVYKVPETYEMLFMTEEELAHLREKAAKEAAGRDARPVRRPTRPRDKAAEAAAGYAAGDTTATRPTRRKANAIPKETPRG